MFYAGVADAHFWNLFVGRVFAALIGVDSVAPVLGVYSCSVGFAESVGYPV